MLRTFAVTTALIGLCLAGCEKESEKGGPGVATNPGGGTDVNETNEENTFSVKVPNAMTLAQGAEEEITIALNRGDIFTESVTIDITPPDGVTVTPNTQVIATGSDELKVRVAVDATATVGAHKIVVRGTPESGVSVDVEIPLTIEAPDDDGDGN